MKQYLDLVRDVIDNGTVQGNRTGIRTISLPGAMLRFDLQKGFPAITTRKLAFKSAIGEMVGFLRGVKNAGEFRDLGCKVWDQNANENAQWLANPFRQGHDDLGEIYGVQWRQWPAYKRIPLSNPAAIEMAAAGAPSALGDAGAGGASVLPDRRDGNGPLCCGAFQPFCGLRVAGQSADRAGDGGGGDACRCGRCTFGALWAGLSGPAWRQPTGQCRRGAGRA